MTRRRADSAVRIAVEAGVAAVLLLALSPLLLVVAVAIRLTSKGPALFRQVRLGADRQPFAMLKFRTMVVDADERIHREYVTALLTEADAPHGGEAGVYKLTSDPRVTRVGGLLRRTSVDELPQLWNVIRGEMALVGPRPVLPWEEPLFPRWAERRFEVRPGLTGLWQVRGRSSLGFQEALALDIEYLDKRSIWLDVGILLRTPLVLVDRRRAR